MYALNHSYIGMSSNQQQYFRNALKSFYKSALYDTQEFEEFESGYKKIWNNKQNPELIENLANYISSYINNHDEIISRGLFAQKHLKQTSLFLAALILREKDMLKNVKQGGRHNFINYVELSIAESVAKDNNLKKILQFEKQETLKSIREMQHYRYNAPDQLLR